MLHQFEIGLALMSEYDEDGFLGIQWDAQGEANSGVIPYQAHHMQGFMARPLDPVVDAEGVPDPSQGGAVLVAMQGGTGHSWALEDSRVVQLLPILRPGEAMAYGSAGQFTRYAADGSITHATTDTGGSPSGNAIFHKMSAAGFEWHAPFGVMRFDATGFHVLTAAGATLDLGAIGGLPPPLDAIGSYARMSAGAVDITGTMVSCGSSGAALPAAQALPLLIYLGLVAQALQTIAAALATASPTSGITAAQTALVQAAITPLLAPPPITSNTAV